MEEVEIAKSVGTTSAESARRSNRKYARNPANAAILKSRHRVETAKRNGTLKAPKACPKCGRTGVKLDFHHTSGKYASKKGDGKPGSDPQLTGRFLCRKCHSSAKTKTGAHQRSGKHMRDARKKGEATRKAS